MKTFKIGDEILHSDGRRGTVVKAANAINTLFQIKWNDGNITTIRASEMSLLHAPTIPKKIKFKKKSYAK